MRHSDASEWTRRRMVLLWRWAVERGSNFDGCTEAGSTRLLSLAAPPRPPSAGMAGYRKTHLQGAPAAGALVTFLTIQ